MSTVAPRQADLPFWDPLEHRVLPRGGWPFWTLNTRGPDGVLRQRPYRLHQLEFVLKNIRTDLDTYMSQAFFDAPCRRAVHLAWLTHAYVDLDLYKLPYAPSAGEAGIMLRLFCRDEGIPEPSIIVFSGRGIYLKWCWASPIPRAAAGRAVAVNRALVRRFTQWGADPASVDVSRLLRVVGTTNSKSGERAAIMWQAECCGDLLTYDFDLFADEVLPYTLEQIRDFRANAHELKAKRDAEVRILSHERARRRADAARKGNARAFCREDWHWGILEDLRTLADLRFGGRVQYAAVGAKVGVDLFGHVGACQLAMVVPAHILWSEVLAWARLLLPPDYVDGDYQRHSSTLVANAKRAAVGAKVTWNGKERSPVWTYRKETLIQLLEITPAEEQRMTRLISDCEKARRHREAEKARRREAGALARADYEGYAGERRTRAQVLREGGLSWFEVARHLELPTAESARQLVRRGR